MTPNKRKLRSQVRVIPFKFPVYCPSCGWKGKRTELAIIKPCPSCGHHPCYRVPRSS